ncbi:unnamed protein product [Durusdinium trenchii]|uniref:Uncharacterized protein n=1 Tax=Durusdinium trenchii TaxID=1381693 RepID=A0ABP0SGD2_9DINO
MARVIGERALKRFDREVAAVLDTLVDRKAAVWSTTEGTSISAQLEDSLHAHLPAIGRVGANAVLMAAFLGRSWASRAQGDSAPRLPAAAYAQLLRRLGHDFAVNWLGLTAAGWQLPEESLAKSLAQQLCTVEKESFCNIAAALLAMANCHRTKVATAVQKVSDDLSLQVAFSMLLALLQDVCETAEQASADWAPLAVSLSSRALQDARAGELPRDLLRTRLERCPDPDVRAAWLQVLEVLGPETERGCLTAPEPWQLDLHPKAEVSEEVALFLAKPSSPPTFLPSPDVIHKAEKSAVPNGGTLRIDLYANPSAKAAQDAVVAALPPSRRCEALLSAAKAEAMHETLPLVLAAWHEAPESCSVVLLRRTPEQQASWPIPVLAPVLVALVRSDAAGWRAWKDGPFDRGLLAATWAGLCREDAPASARFIFWVLSEVVIPNLSSNTTRRFAAETAGLLADTLKADLFARRAEMQRAEVLQEGLLPSGAATRLQSLQQVPLAPLVLSLAEALSDQSAEDALVSWLNVATGIKDLPPQEVSTMQRCVDLHLARISVAKESATGYAGQLLRALMGADGDHLVQALAACVNPQQRAARGPVDLWLLLSAALHWPSRRLSDLVLKVLPEIFSDLTVLTPNSSVKGYRLDCSGRFVDFGVRVPVLRCVHCLYCCVLAESLQSPSEAANFLRSACEVTRNGVATLKVGCLQHLSTHFAAFLTAFLDMAPQNSPGLRAALLLVQSMRRKLGPKAPERLALMDDRLKSICA